MINKCMRCGRLFMVKIASATKAVAYGGVTEIGQHVGICSAGCKPCRR